MGFFGVSRCNVQSRFAASEIATKVIIDEQLLLLLFLNRRTTSYLDSIPMMIIGSNVYSHLTKYSIPDELS